MMDCSLCQYVELFIRYYIYAWLAGLGVYCLLILASKVGRDGNKFKYYAKYGMIYYTTQAFTTLFAPISLLRPNNPVNAGIISAVVSHASNLLPITWELRNARILREAQGAVVMANHQSSMDILGLQILWSTMRNVISIAKKEMLFFFPFGPTAWLAGITFLNRKNRTSAMKTLGGCKRKMMEHGFKMYLFPEGTRYPERGMLPFKKGGFHTAIEAGVPIIPIVFSHMYFIDAKKYSFKAGHVLINVLEPIPTKDLTKDNLDELIKRTRDAMLEEYEKLSAEMDANLTDPKWVRTSRPRFAVYEYKKTN